MIIIIALLLCLSNFAFCHSCFALFHLCILGVFLHAFFVHFITKLQIYEVKAAAGKKYDAYDTLTFVSADVKTLLFSAVCLKFQYIPYFFLLIVKDNMYGIYGDMGYSADYNAVRTLIAKVHIIKLNRYIIADIINTVCFLIKAVAVYIVTFATAYTLVCLLKFREAETTDMGFILCNYVQAAHSLKSLAELKGIGLVLVPYHLFMIYRITEQGAALFFRNALPQLQGEWIVTEGKYRYGHFIGAP